MTNRTCSRACVVVISVVRGTEEGERSSSKTVNFTGVIVIKNEFPSKYVKDRIFLVKIENRKKYIFFSSRMTCVS